MEKDKIFWSNVEILKNWRILKYFSRWTLKKFWEIEGLEDLCLDASMPNPFLILDVIILPYYYAYDIQLIVSSLG